MMNENRYEKAKELAMQWGQEHLLRHYAQLADEEKQILLQQIMSVDFERIMCLYRNAVGQPQGHAQHTITPITAVNKPALSDVELNRLTDIGMDAVRRGQYAVVTMAGGQGTRLGFEGPKGSYVVDLDRPRSLFEVQLEQIKGLSLAANAPIPWYIMTSDQNHEATVAFFTQHGNFGYEHIQFFRQSSLPMVSLDGKLLMDSPYSILQGPDGNGTIFRSLKSTGMAEDMRRRGVRWFFVCNVDNILAPCGDPLPIGVAVRHGVPAVSKSVMKRSPDEKAGVFCRIDGRHAVIEYTEISPQLAHQTTPSGNLVFGDAHISCTLFHTDVIELVEHEQMPYHTAVKKASFVDEAGQLIAPTTENAFKFEAFIFDVFPKCHDIAVLRVDRNEEFAPIKNACGEDSPQSARELYMRRFSQR